MDSKTLATEARKKILTMVHKAGTSHIASNFSVIDIATVLYENLKEGDEVVWSKGWAAASVYYFLAKQGKIPCEDLDKFPNPPYLGLAETFVNGVLVSGGSVGHGLSMAVGIALAKKRSGQGGIVYCVMSDGELNEGSVWEAVIMAAHHKLDNLVAIIDQNGWQAMGRTEDILDVNPLNAFEGFGWHAVALDGHDYEKLDNGMYIARNHGLSPLVLVCNTVKGKGVSFFEDHLLYHYKHVEKDEFERAMAELEGASVPV